jgi:hypothetical protein
MKTGRGHLGGSVGNSEGKGEESAMTILRFLCGSPRLCRLRTEGLVPVSKYWTYRSHAGDMGPVSLVACHRQKLGLSLLLHWLAWKRNWVRTHGLVSRRAEPFFSGAVGSVQIYRWLEKGYHVRGLPVGSVRRTYVDWHGKRTCRVDQVFSCRVYINSNHCDSWIWVTACSWLPSSSNLLD